VTSLHSVYSCQHGRPHIGANGSADPWKNGWIIRKRKHAKKISFLCLCYILRAIGAGRCRERRYADHIFIQVYFCMHHFVVNFNIFFASGGKGALIPLPKSCGRSWLSYFRLCHHDITCMLSVYSRTPNPRPTSWVGFRRCVETAQWDETRRARALYCN